MSARRQGWIMPALVALAAVLGSLAVQSMVAPREAAAQGDSATTGYVTVVTAAAHQGRVPLFVVDSKSQAIMIYEYDLSRRSFYLRSVRNFLNDRRVIDNEWDRSVNKGPSVKEVGKYVTNQ